MHRDHKLGLALGVLVVGFAAALCFPKPTDIDQRLLQLDSTAELDADIAQLPVHAYTEADPAPAPEPLPPTAEVIDPAQILPGGDGNDELFAGPPEPIPTEFVPTEIADAAEQPAPLPEARITAPTQQYTVRSGDTLSSIAAQLLGNHSRYIELFDANREILATPDDLQVGMVLNVPGTVAEAALVMPGESARPHEDAANNATAAPENVAPGDSSSERTRRFRPARSPLISAQPVSQTNSSGLPAMDATDRSTATAVESASQTYTVRRGDTLEQIAVKTYGDARAVRDIVEANPSAVSDPRRLRPGMTLVLPSR